MARIGTGRLVLASNHLSGLQFDIIKTDGRARRGTLMTAHGIVDTPAFMPVGTAATVKAMTPEAVRKTGAQIILGNTYHLMLRPTAERIKHFGGLHKFMNWPGPILTDSGGYQIMSMSGLRKIEEEGVTFRSHIDGSYHKLTPERAVQIQHLLNADITMALDECTSFPATEEEAKNSMLLSMRWAERCKKSYKQRPGYGLFGIVQGGIFPEIREQSAITLIEMGFDGYAIGGLAVGEGQEIMFKTIETTGQHLPIQRPRYLMGVGKPEDIVGAVRRGIDMFDCVLPTRSGRTDQAFTRRGSLNLRNARHKDDQRPIDPDCNCYACSNYARGYVHHLVLAKEILAAILLTWHNLHYYQELMAAIRTAIATNKFDEFIAHFSTEQGAGDIEPFCRNN